MRSLAMTRPGKFTWTDQPDPRIVADSDALVRPFIVGRCDGDQIPTSGPLLTAIRLAQRARALDPVLMNGFGSTPFPRSFHIGHESVGQVVEVGSATTAVRVGDTVIVPYQVSCGRCPQCAVGRTGLCETARQDPDGSRRELAWFGHGHATGVFGGMAADLIRVPWADSTLVPVPSGLDPFRIAAASDNLSEGWRVTAPHLLGRERARVLVVGGLERACGLYAAGLAVAMGHEVVYSDSSSARLEIAARLGATVEQRTHLYRFRPPVADHDVVIDASNAQPGLTHAIRATAPGGTCVVPSYHLAARTGVPMMHLTFRDIDLHVGMNHAHPRIRELLEWLTTNDFAAETVTTRIVEWDDADRQYAAKTTKLIMARDPIPTTAAGGCWQ